MQELEAGIGVADAFGSDVRDAVAVCVRRLRAWLPGEIGAHAVWSREARTLADQDHDTAGAESGRDRVANRHAAQANNDQWTDPPALGAQLRQDAGEDRLRMG